MLVIRLSRVGRKKLPMYRVLVQEKGRDPWGAHVEIVGHMNPHTNPATLTLKEDRVKHWLDNGAQPSDTVWNLLVEKGLVKGEKKNKITISKKRQGKMDEAKAKEEEKKAEAEAAEEAAKEDSSTAEAAQSDSSEDESKEEPKEEAASDSSEDKSEEKKTEE